MTWLRLWAINLLCAVVNLGVALFLFAEGSWLGLINVVVAAGSIWYVHVCTRNLRKERGW